MSYQGYLKGFEGTESNVTLHREGAPSISGTVQKVSPDGCTLEVQDDMYFKFVFVAHRDIRGVESDGGLDPDMLG